MAHLIGMKKKKILNIKNSIIVALKQLNNSENITLKELNEVYCKEIGFIFF